MLPSRAELEDPLEMDSEDDQDELSKILNEVRSSFSPPKSGARRERRTRRFKALSFGSGLMLIVYNTLRTAETVDGQPDIISLAAAILITVIAALQFASELAKGRGTPGSGLHLVALLLVAGILATQAWGVI